MQGIVTSINPPRALALFRRATYGGKGRQHR